MRHMVYLPIYSKAEIVLIEDNVAYRKVYYVERRKNVFSFSPYLH